PFPGYYSVTSYAGNHGSKNFWPVPSSTGNSSTDDGMFYVWGGPNSTASVCYPRPSPLPCVRHEAGVAMKTVSDGTSKTILFGERYNQDDIFDSIFVSDRNELLIHQWALWGWTGGYSGTAHATRGAGDAPTFKGVMNRQCPQSCRGSGGGYQCADD